MNLLHFNLLLIYLFSLSSLSAQNFKLMQLVGGYSQPVDIVSTYEEDDDRLFIVQKNGIIKITNIIGQDLGTFLNIDSKVGSNGNERGLLGLCFDKNYSINRNFYVNYTNNNGNTVIAKYSTDPNDINKAILDSEIILLTIDQPFSNHNGGDLNIGPDGMLYIGLGDGGSGGDPGNRAQNPKELLGKMLRINPNSNMAQPYEIPLDNPFANSIDTLAEIWSIGLRNPWRFSFDRLTGEMYIADVGQDKWEEINVEPFNTGGINYGWRCYEGFDNYNTTGCGNFSNYKAPVHVYQNITGIGCSITGGYVYRGVENPSLYGKYIYTDFCSGKFWSLYKDNSNVWTNIELADLVDQDYVSFGEDYNGELYVAGLTSGNIYKIIDQPSSTNSALLTSNVENFHITTNPTISSVSWKYKSNILNKKIQINLFNQSGLLLNTIEINKMTEEVEGTMNIENLPSGEYILQVNGTKNGKIFIKG